MGCRVCRPRERISSPERKCPRPNTSSLTTLAPPPSPQLGSAPPGHGLDALDPRLDPPGPGAAGPGPASAPAGSGIAGPAIKRVARAIEETSNAAGGTDLGSKAPSYRVRKSIRTARVNLGASVFKKYDLSDRVLGTGVSGAVRVCVERSSGREFACKTLSLENITSKKAAMFRNEVDIYLKVDHPNICKLVEVYEDDKIIYLIMELCTGRELYDRLAMKQRYTEADAAHLAQQMLEAVNYCHKHRICHRDLKLENWVYASDKPDAPLKLIDFGFSRIFSAVIPMTAMHGTVYYVSPEVMDGCYREKCDIWSLGVIVYMLLSGVPPFNGTVDYQILLKIRSAQYDFEACIWQSVSDEAKDFISHLLVKDPNQRYSADEALHHPWLTAAHAAANAATRGPMDEAREIQVLTDMRQFALSNIMKRAAVGLVAQRFTTADVQDLHEQFKKLDKQKKGSIKLQDLVTALTEKLGVSQKEAANVFAMIDQTGDHEVHYTEFLAATLHKKLLEDGSWMHEAFEKLDHDKSGHITVEDLRAVLGDSFNNIPVETIMATCDPEGNGLLTFEKFAQVIMCPEGPDCVVTEESTMLDQQALETRASFSEAVVSMQLQSPQTEEDGGAG